MIDALDFLESIHQPKPYMYGADSYIDGPNAEDYNPRSHAARLGVPIVEKVDLPTLHMAACYSRRWDAIFVRPNIHADLERCSLAHEIVHFEHHDRGTTSSQETRADRVAARRLIRPSRLQQVAALTDDHGRMALELGVTERIMRAYLRLVR